MDVNIDGFLFNGDTRTCTLKPGVTSYTEVEIYSAWKKFALSNGQFLPMFDVEGSEETVILLFIRNDIFWTIKPPEENINVNISGNILARDPEGDPWKQKTNGTFNASIDVVRTLAGSSTSADVNITISHPVDWETVVSELCESQNEAFIDEDFSVFSNVDELEIEAVIEDGFEAIIEEEIYEASVC